MRWTVACIPRLSDADEDALEEGAGSKDSTAQATPQIRKIKPKKRIGSYEFTGQVLGAGATAAVYHARCVNTGREVAIKCLPACRGPFPKEVLALRQVASSGHPHICEFLEHRRSKGVDYIVLDYCSGGEVYQSIEDYGAMDEVTVRQWSYDMVSGLRFVHEAGVVHRDLKLENFLFSTKGARTIKLCDFGLSFVYPRIPDSNFMYPLLCAKCGTQSYTPPEMLAKYPEYEGFPVDIWALGVCIFSMCSGFFPVEEASEEDWRFCRLVAAQTEGVSSCMAIFGFYNQQCHFSPELIDLLDGMLQVEPSRRPTIQAIAKHGWFDCMALAANGDIRCTLLDTSFESEESMRTTHEDIINMMCSSDAAVSP